MTPTPPLRVSGRHGASPLLSWRAPLLWRPLGAWPSIVARRVLPARRSGATRRRAAGAALAPALFLALALACRSAGAEPIQQLHDFLAHASSARGEFTQTAPGGGKGAKPAVSHGRFEFQRPGRFLWEYNKPYEQLIVSDGKALFLYDKDLAQVTKRALAGALPASPASILFGSNDFEKDFHVSADGEGGGIEWIRAVAQAKDSPFERIRIGFRDGLPAAMELRDSFGQQTILAFDKVERNPALPAGHFAFTPPPGADVLEDK